MKQRLKVQIAYICYPI